MDVDVDSFAQQSTVDENMEQPDYAHCIETSVKNFFKTLRRHKGNQKLSDEANESLRLLLASFTNFAKSKVSDRSSKQCIDSVHLSVNLMIKAHSSTCKRNNAVKASKFYIEPRTLSCGVECVKKNVGGDVSLVNEQCLFQFIPITETLKALFQSAAFRQAFTEKDHECKEYEYRGACCGSVARTGSFSNIEGEVKVMIQLFYDGLSPANGLKCNASKYSTGVVYFRILNLPAKYQSHLSNIHLVSLFLERWFKRAESRSMCSILS